MSDPCTECGQDTGHFSYLIDGNPAKRICNACYIYKKFGSPSPEAAEIARLRASLTAASPAVVAGLVRIAQAAKRLDDMLTDGGPGYMVSAESAEELHNALQGYKPSEATNE